MEDRSSHTMGIGVCTSQSSELDDFSLTLSNQHAVAMAPSDNDSVRNLFKILTSERPEGGIKSHGNIMKSCLMRWAKCCSIAEVPTAISSVSSKICKSMRRDENEEEVESEWI